MWSKYYPNTPNPLPLLMRTSTDKGLIPTKSRRSSGRPPRGKLISVMFYGSLLPATRTPRTTRSSLPPDSSACLWTAAAAQVALGLQLRPASLALPLHGPWNQHAWSGPVSAIYWLRSGELLNTLGPRFPGLAIGVVMVPSHRAVLRLNTARWVFRAGLWG